MISVDAWSTLAASGGVGGCIRRPIRLPWESDFVSVTIVHSATPLRRPKDDHRPPRSPLVICLSLKMPSSSSLHESYSTARVLMTPIGWSKQVPIRLFLDHVLPPLRHSLDVTQIAEQLCGPPGTTSRNTPITSRGRWRGFAQDPARSERSEQSAFCWLKSAFSAITKASSSAVGAIEPVLHFHNNTNCVMRSTARTASTLPDSYFSLDESRLPTPSTIGVCGEHKKSDCDSDIRDVSVILIWPQSSRLNEEPQNNAKVTASMAKCLREDPRRRFVYGFTIENTSMRLWFCDRAQLLVSEPFNFILVRVITCPSSPSVCLTSLPFLVVPCQEHQHVVHFSLAAMYADPARLGWDPTMLPLRDGRNFDVTVRSDDGARAVYRTLDLISDTGAQVPFSRGTRVWKAVLLEDGKEHGEPVVLKDVWVQPEGLSEGAKINAVHSAERVPVLREFVDVSFLTVLTHGDVFLDDARELRDRTLTLPLEGISTERPVSDIRRQKTHYRLVSAELCRPIHQEESLSKIFEALAYIVHSQSPILSTCSPIPTADLEMFPRSPVDARSRLDSS